ncbi:MAG: hypothetical protein K1000chlam2_01605 [Chlamydiae bacterium]|nr:hypothetical protein [Chlamydiota bacterium]
MSSPLSLEKLLSMGSANFFREHFKENLGIKDVENLQVTSKTCKKALDHFENQSPFHKPLKDTARRKEFKEVQVSHRAKKLQVQKRKVDGQTPPIEDCRQKIHEQIDSGEISIPKNPGKTLRKKLF